MRARGAREAAPHASGDARARRAHGDWQTPAPLAEAVLARLAARGVAPASVLEPTCGEGAFLVAAARAFPSAQLHGFELSPAYAATARARLPEARASVHVADFFAVDWAREIERLPSPILVVGNPPWVTSATLGALGAKNRPVERDTTGLRGLEARTGRSNFDVSEWMILRLLRALAGREATLAMICKAAVARRVIERASAANEWVPNDSTPRARPGAVFAIDAQRYFAAAASAVVLECELGASRGAREGEPEEGGWPVFDGLEAARPRARWGVVDGVVVPDAGAHARTAELAGACAPIWRSGLKHDCARVMELAIAEPEADGGRGVDGPLLDADGAPVELDPSTVFPLLKGSDVARALAAPTRAVIVPQRALGEETATLADSAPATFRHLVAHREALRARKSSIYRGQPEFAIFGIGPYAFAPWKVAISALHKRLAFLVVGPHRGRPVMLDDTCYFLPFDDEASARAACAALSSERARAFFDARIFWDDKRPIRKAVLQRLDLARLVAEPAGR